MTSLPENAQEVHMGSLALSAQPSAADISEGRIARVLREGKTRASVAVAYSRIIRKVLRSTSARNATTEPEFPPVPAEEGLRERVEAPVASAQQTEPPAYPYTAGESGLAHYFAQLADSYDASSDDEVPGSDLPIAANVPRQSDSTRFEVPPTDDSGGQHAFERSHAGSTRIVPQVDELPQYQLNSSMDAGPSTITATVPETALGKTQAISSSLERSGKKHPPETKDRSTGNTEMPAANQVLLRDEKDAASLMT